MTNAEELAAEEKIHFYTLNVGQGDSHVIHFPTRKAAIVIDPGNSDLINELLHNHLEIEHLPLILISHFDLDHMKGLNGILLECLKKTRGEAIKPGYIFFSDQGFGKSIKCKTISGILDDFEQLAEKYNLLHEYSIADNSSSELFKEVLSNLGIEGRIIYPKRMQQKEAFTKDNHNLASVLLYIIFANQKILYTGDLPYKGWEKVDNREELKSDVFKVPHHGGRISKTPGPDTQQILKRVDPNFALISVGSNNSFKHPIPEVVDAIVSHQTKPHLFCTQMTGQCCPDNNIKEKIHRFYEEQLGNREEKRIFKLGSQQGTLCAGTIRVTFDKNRSVPYIFPPVSTHYNMLKTLLKPHPILCRGRF